METYKLLIFTALIFFIIGYTTQITIKRRNKKRYFLITFHSNYIGTISWVSKNFPSQKAVIETIRDKYTNASDAIIISNIIEFTEEEFKAFNNKE